jgi:hypothetical protein
MRHALLILSIAGFLLSFWSVAASLGRPTSFDLLSEAVLQSGASPEAQQRIELSIQELKRSHLAEVENHSTAHQIALGGLVFLSGSSLFLYVRSRQNQT